MDVKKLGRIPDGGGWRIHGRGIPQTDQRPGLDYAHSLVDDHSRLAYSEILPDEKGTTCAAFLAGAIDYFAAHGITHIEELMTDNAWACRYSPREICALHDIKQVFLKAPLPTRGRTARLAPEPHRADRVVLPPSRTQQRRALRRT
jgi:hypothetical protein